MAIGQEQWTPALSERFEGRLGLWAEQGYHEAEQFLPAFRACGTRERRRKAANAWLSSIQHETITDTLTGDEDPSRKHLKRLIGEWRQLERV